MHGHVEPFCGASGDMLLGALVDAGAPLATLQAAVDALEVPGLSIQAERVNKLGIAATQVTVAGVEDHQHRHLPHIERIIQQSELAATVKERALAVFHELARAEAAVHGLPVERVHFHEVGALDAIADVVGVVSGLAALGIETLSCRALPLSHGTVNCEHGLLPVPAPAVLRLAEGLPTEPLDVNGETLTPTAAALLRVLVSHWGQAPPLQVTGQGYGAGRKEFPRANVLRLMLGEANGAAAELRTLTLLSTNVDDMNPEWLPVVLERLLAAGARDAWLTPILMKKGRPAHTLNVLAEGADATRLRELIYTHTSSLGVRQSTVERHHLPRQSVAVTTPWGPVTVKVAALPGGATRAAPEFEDCRRLALTADVPVQVIYEAALRAWRETPP